MPVKRLTGKNVSVMTYNVWSGRINTTYLNSALGQTTVAGVTVQPNTTVNRRCHGNEIWDKIGYNWTYMKDIPEIFA